MAIKGVSKMFRGARRQTNKHELEAYLRNSSAQSNLESRDHGRPVVTAKLCFNLSWDFHRYEAGLDSDIDAMSNNAVGLSVPTPWGRKLKNVYSFKNIAYMVASSSQYGTGPCRQYHDKDKMGYFHKGPSS